MTQEFLSQDEVDTLLKGVNGDAESANPASGQAGARPYNLATQERIVRSRMPGLERVHTRFARLLREGLFNFMRRSPEISVGPVRVIKYEEFTNGLVAPTNLNVAQVKPLRGNALFVFEPALIFLVVDNLFGGDGRFQTRVEGREFTATEQRIIRNLLSVVFDDYQRSWENVFPLTFEYVRSEMHTQFACIAQPTEVVVVSSFTIELGQGGGTFHICIPYATLEPIRDALYRPQNGDQAEPDQRWGHQLARQVQEAEVEIVAKLAATTLTVGQLLATRAGDVLPLEIAPLLCVEADGVPLLECSYGIVNGRYALQVERTIMSDPQFKAGGSHG